jgi:hypothetical protein
LLFGQGKLRPVADADGPEAQDQAREADTDNPNAREAWFRSGRRAAGEHAADLLHRAYRQKMEMSASQPASAQQPAPAIASPGQNTASGIPFTGTTYAGPWTNLGPAPIASDPSQDYGKVVGRVTSIAVDHGDTTGGTVYIGAAFGGAWKSTNANAADPTTVTWTPIIDNQPTLAVGAITVQPGTTGNTAVVLIGTGESNSSGDSYYGMGILRSMDGGTTWAPIIKTADGGAKTFSGLGASKFAWNGQTVVVGMGSTNGKEFGSDSVGGRGIYYSTNAGQTWQYANVQDPDPTTGNPTQNLGHNCVLDSSPAYCLTEGTVTDVAYNSNTGKFYAFYRYHGFYESTDGVNWSRSNSQPPSQSTTTPLNVQNCPTKQPNTPNPTGTCPLYRGQIAIQPVTHVMYVIYVDSSDNLQGVFFTSDPSASNNAWTPLQNSGTPNGHVTDTCVPTATCAGGTINQGDYNLWIGAISTGSGTTDLLVGTRDIYKCSLSSTNINCNTGWMNMTFVYGCSPTAAPSHLHPDQHGFDYIIANGQTLAYMYFGNDGGVYRSLNGTSSSTGTCASPNPFDNLDANMGSLSEMVSFSQHPTNQGVILGGLQDNGSPALGVSGASGQLWQIVNGADGGFNEIDPNNTNTWYTEYSILNNSLTIQQCTMGTSCNPGFFGLPNTPPNPPFPAVASNIASPQVGNDVGEFYTPYIIDTANTGTSTLVVGTCRLWRGPGAGGTAWTSGTTSGTANLDISPAFDSSATVPCTASGTSTKIRSIAAGGPAPAGISQVIYVGLEGAGTGPDSGGNVGHVFVNTAADVSTGTHGATNGWKDVTPNPGATFNSGSGTYGPYPVASIQIDPHDPTGKTAYSTVEGFGLPHVFKTTTAGQSWTDISNNLPDAPVDSIAVDPDDPNVLYLGTDVGAFISTNGGTAWQIFGTGLPNVPVTKIRVFDSSVGGAKFVRVSTYGRGVWQFSLPLPMPVNVSPSTLPQFTGTVQTATAPQMVTVSNPGSSGGPAVSITAIGFSNNAFTQSGGTCAVGTSLAAAAGNCTIPVVFTATTGGQTTGTLTLADSVGVSHSVSLSGTAGDFTVAATGSNGSSQTVNAGQPATYTLSVTGTNGFTGNVTFACSSGVPTNASCAFSPSTPVAVTSAAQSVTLTISTMAHSAAQPAPTSGSLAPPLGGNDTRPALLIGLGMTALLVLTQLKPLRALIRAFALLALVGTMALAPACGGGGGGGTTTPPPPSGGTPAGTYTVTVTATSANRSQQIPLTLKVN